jgi:thiamine phosphate synthase YjbQ (UPF0047 family)
VIHQHLDELVVATKGRGFYEITREVQQKVRASGLRTGLATPQLLHTSAALLIQRLK